ncbi:MAG: ATP-binding protein [Bacteroides sp]|nr:ATP-binding protein [Bacteroides sp.]
MEKTLVQQNPQWNGKPFKGLANRRIMQNLLDKQHLPHIQILTGVRRCGKSTIFKLLMNDLLASGISPKTILNINLDAPVFIPLWDNAQHLNSIIEAAEQLTGEKVQYLFLDEVQQIQDWEIYVKAVYDTQAFRKIYITGSNSNLLKNRFSSLLSGRYFANEIRPFSIAESLATIGVHSTLDGYQNLPQVLRLTSNLIKYGSFPEIVLGKMNDDIKTELLHSYFDSIVQKDCILYNAIRDPHLFYRCTHYLLQNAGNRFSLQQLGKSLNSNENTMGSYLNYLCDSYICTDIRNFSFSQKETKRSEHKCYCIDNGLMQANTQRFSPDSGRFFENLVFNELCNKGYENISFDNSKGECDFIAWKDGNVHAFQVCYELNEHNKSRELNGFSIPQLSLASKTLITFNQKEEIEGIQIVPLWEWGISKR